MADLTEREAAELAKARERAEQGNTIPWAEAKRIIDAETDDAPNDLTGEQLDHLIHFFEGDH